MADSGTFLRYVYAAIRTVDCFPDLSNDWSKLDRAKREADAAIEVGRDDAPRESSQDVFVVARFGNPSMGSPQ
jgi:hypothetical protein